MGFYLGSMLITVVSNVGYPLCQRSISGKIHPLFSLILTYAVALAVSLAAFPFFSAKEQTPLADQLKLANWASYALGLAAVGLELGFLLAYRAGWKISVAALVSNTCVTILLVPIGWLAFHEHLDARRALGLILASGGLWLLVPR